MRFGTTDGVIAEINAAPRAIVCLSVPWSCYASIAQADLAKAVARLVELQIAVEAFVLDEELDIAQRWLVTLGLPPPYQGNGIPQGWGAMLWLEFGSVVEWTHHGNEQRAVGVIGRTKALWTSGM